MIQPFKLFLFFRSKPNVFNPRSNPTCCKPNVLTQTSFTTCSPKFKSSCLCSGTPAGAQRTKQASWPDGGGLDHQVRACRIVFDFIATAYQRHFSRSPGYDADWSKLLSCKDSPIMEFVDSPIMEFVNPVPNNYLSTRAYPASLKNCVKTQAF